jgi:hypothetical protein
VSKLERWSALTGIGAVVLWVVGMIVRDGLSDNLSDKASDPQILAWVQGNTNDILLGSWLFMLGCVCFVWFAGVLRGRLVDAEGGAGTVSSIVFGSAVAMVVFGVLSSASDLGAAINKNDISAATAGALHHATDLFFVGAEMMLIPFLAGIAVLAFRTAVLPKWWAVIGAVVAAVAVIGPIGWLAVIFGLPVWTLVTAFMLATRSGAREATSAPAAA